MENGTQTMLEPNGEPTHPIKQTHETSATARSFLDRWVVKIGNLVSLMFLVSAAIIIWEIIARYVFNSPTFWVHETTTLICGLLFAYGGAHCIAQDKHIRIVVVYEKVSPRFRRWLDVLIYTLCTFYTAGLSWAAWLVVGKSIFTPQGAFRMETSGSAWDPPFPAISKLFLFFVLLLMLAQFLLLLAACIKGKRDA